MSKITFDKSFFKSRKENLTMSDEKNKDKLDYQATGEVENNPYLQSKKLYDDIYGSAEKRYKSLLLIIFLLISLLCLTIFGMIYVGSKSKFIPYVVEIQNGQVIYTGIAENPNFSSLKPQLANTYIQNFLKSARSVSLDGDVVQNNQEEGFALTKGAATNELSEYYKAHDPYVIVQKNTITVEVNYINTLPNNVFQVGWTEISKDSQSGQVLSTDKYEGEFIYTWGDPSQNKDILKYNPFGFYITNISWTGVK